MARRKRKAAFIEYDYEAAYEKQLHDLEESNAERMLKEGKVRRSHRHRCRMVVGQDKT